MSGDERGIFVVIIITQARRNLDLCRNNFAYTFRRYDSVRTLNTE